MGVKPRAGVMGVLSTTIGADVCFGAVKGTVQPGDMTYFRMSTEDTGGYIKACVGEGRLACVLVLQV